MKEKKNKINEQKIEELAASIQKYRETESQLRMEAEQLSDQFAQAEQSRFIKILQPRTLKQFLRMTGAYILGRRNRKQLYSKAYKQKQASNELKPYVRALYNDGFTEQALDDLIHLNKTTNNRYLRTSTAWELALYYANKEAAYYAPIALQYLQEIESQASSKTSLRQRKLLEAECLLLLDEQDKAKHILQELAATDLHPDVLLGLANSEVKIENKLNHINKVYKLYDLQPIKFNAQSAVTYDDLMTDEPPQQTLNGPKISVILPAYNCEEGIKTAIDSMLEQTWKNIELLIVDDCSTDNTYEVILQYANQDERIKAFQTKTNSGPYVARNLALQKATGEFVTVNDADDWSHAEKLAIQVCHLIDNPSVIANTSQLSRLTEELQFYRRGTRGKYLFSNMSSLMFRRKLVLEKIGYWDTVRFAADGEYKRRMVRAFGKGTVIDLETGPLSLPRQTSGSLTGSSAFGYNGHFTGARREYVESFSNYHEQADSLYYPPTQTERLFPVPAPMLPNRQAPKQIRNVDIIFVADFYRLAPNVKQEIIANIKVNKERGLTTGLVQMAEYALDKQEKFDREIRHLIDGKNVQMLVYGENVQTQIVIVTTPKVLQYWQQYIPHIITLVTLITIDKLPIMKYNGEVEQIYKFRDCRKQIMTYFNKQGRWFPIDAKMRKSLTSNANYDVKAIPLAHEDWHDENNATNYETIIKHWLT